MKQFTSPKQTAKLIKLGLPKPESILGHDGYWGYDYAYTIGELLSFLPENIAKIEEMPSTLNISLMNGEWCVQYADFIGVDFEFCNCELIDALYDMAVILKEMGVI